MIDGDPLTIEPDDPTLSGPLEDDGEAETYSNPAGERAPDPVSFEDDLAFVVGADGEGPAAKEPDYDPELVAEARRYGWRPEAEWKGKPPPQGFLPPDKFLETGAVAKKRVQELQEEARRTVEERVAPLVEMERQRIRAEYTRLAADYDDAIRHAVQRGDVRLWDDLQQERDQRLGAILQRAREMPRPVEAVEPQSTAAAAEPTDEDRQYAAEWRIKYAALSATPEAQLVTRELLQQVTNDARSNRALATYSARLDEVARRAAKLRPDLFRWSVDDDGGDDAPVPPMVERGARASMARSTSRSLPNEARAQRKADLESGIYGDVSDPTKRRAAEKDWEASYWKAVNQEY